MSLILTSSMLYVVSFVGIAAAPNWPLRFACGTVNGIVMGILFIVGHDACHGSLTPSSAVNKVLGRLAMLPGWHAFASWEFSHNGLHHAYTNLRGLDPVYPPFSKAEFDALPRYRRTLERFYRTFLGVGLFYWIEVWCKHEMFLAEKHRRRLKSRTAYHLDRLSVAGCAMLQCLSLLALTRHLHPDLVVSAGSLALLLWIGLIHPFAVWMWSMGFLTFQHHTHPRTGWYADAREWSYYRGHLRSTVHIIFPRFVAVILHDVMDHTAHHVDPKIPLYRLHGCQARLEAAYPGAIVVEAWNVRQFLHTLRVCKLYDYHRHQWLDFAGRPTAEPLRHATGPGSPGPA